METSAALRSLMVPDAGGAGLQTLVMYPTNAAEMDLRLGPYTESLAPEGRIAAGGPYPLVVVSHGTGGSPVLYRSLAAHLARNGFVVALPEHPQNNRGDNTLAGTVEILANRPAHLRAVIDAVLADGTLAPVLQPGAVAILGHSLGGYTALTLAGGHATTTERETGDGEPEPIATVADERVSALVLLAPATPWFAADGALADVRVPILMLTAEHDAHTPSWQGEIVVRGVGDPALVEHREIANAGHFSFQTPFPPHMVDPAFEPSQDPEGFDRPGFHEELNRDVTAFLQRVSGAAAS